MPPPEFLKVRAGGGKSVSDVGDITDALHCDMARRGSITLGRPGMPQLELLLVRLMGLLESGHVVL